jgi:hypothetical protein
MNKHLLKAGIARADITPEIGLNLTGYAVREGMPKTVDEALSLTVLALREEDQTILIVAADLCLIDVPSGYELRRACAEAAGIASSHVLVNLSHSHSAPGIGSYAEFDPPDQQALRTEYWRKLLISAADAVRRALSGLAPARLAVGWGECRGNINRRQKTPDGTVLLGEDPAGACDSSVGVIRVDAMDGRPIAVAFRYSCHTVTLGPKTNRVSPDFAGPARRVVESALGCPSLFLQGCAGNINPATGIGQDADDSPCVDEDKDRLGHMLGGEVIKVAQTLRTHRRRSEPVLVESVGRYWLFGYEAVPATRQGPLAALETELTLPLTPFPPLAEVETERAEWAAKLQSARQQDGREWNVNPLIRFDHWAQKRLDAARGAMAPVSISFPLQSLRIGGLKILAIPFEAMAETGLALREALGPDTFVLGFSNGIVSYLPTPEISAEGGMEAKLGYKAYLVPSEVPGTWEPAIRENLAASALLL